MGTTFFLPGAGASADFWQAVGAHIDFQTTPHYFSWPGLGHEPHDRNINSLNDLITLVLNKIDDQSNLVAQSMGGLIAIEAAIRAPHKIQKLVLTATSAGLPMTTFGATNWKTAYLTEYPHAQKWVTDIHTDLTAILEMIAIPTLLIWGDKDPISPLSVGMRLQEIMPYATLHIVPGGAHDMAITHAKDIAPIIAQHLADTI